MHGTAEVRVAIPTWNPPFARSYFLKILSNLILIVLLFETRHMKKNGIPKKLHGKGATHFIIHGKDRTNMQDDRVS